MPYDVSCRVHSLLQKPLRMLMIRQGNISKGLGSPRFGNVHLDFNIHIPKTVDLVFELQ